MTWFNAKRRDLRWLEVRSAHVSLDMTRIEEDAQNFSQYLRKQGAAGQIWTSLKNYNKNLQNKKGIFLIEPWQSK